MIDIKLLTAQAFNGQELLTHPKKIVKYAKQNKHYNFLLKAEVVLHLNAVSSDQEGNLVKF